MYFSLSLSVSLLSVSATGIVPGSARSDTNYVGLLHDDASSQVSSRQDRETCPAHMTGVLRLPGLGLSQFEFRSLGWRVLLCLWAVVAK